MTIDVFIPAIGQQKLVDTSLAFLTENSVLNWTRSTVIDNASIEPITSEWADVIRNETNLGMVRSLQQSVEHSDADILVYMHSDMFIYEEGWDQKISDAFEADPKLAVLGVVGAKQADSNGGRSGTVCAFRDAHLHGAKPTQLITPVALLDGCFMAFRRDVLELLPWDEFEENGYLFSYDKGITLWLTMHSYHVGVVNFDSEHLGGRTSCQKEFNDTLKDGLDAMYKASEQKYLDRWKDALPVHVTPEWVVHVGRSM